MPFVNNDQRKACYAQKRKNPNSTWDCSKWDRHTKMRRKRKLNRRR